MSFSLENKRSLSSVLIRLQHIQLSSQTGEITFAQMDLIVRCFVLVSWPHLSLPGVTEPHSIISIELRGRGFLADNIFSSRQDLIRARRTRRRFSALCTGYISRRF